MSKTPAKTPTDSPVFAALPPYCSPLMWAQLTGQSEAAVKHQIHDGKVQVVDLREDVPGAKNRHLMINVTAEMKRAADAAD